MSASKITPEPVPILSLIYPSLGEMESILLLHIKIEGTQATSISKKKYKHNDKDLNISVSVRSSNTWTVLQVKMYATNVTKKEISQFSFSTSTVDICICRWSCRRTYRSGSD